MTWRAIFAFPYLTLGLLRRLLRFRRIHIRHISVDNLALAGAGARPCAERIEFGESGARVGDGGEDGGPDKGVRDGRGGVRRLLLAHLGIRRREQGGRGALPHDKGAPQEQQQHHSDDAARRGPVACASVWVNG